MKIAEKSELKAQLRKFQTASDSYMRLLSELKKFLGVRSTFVLARVCIPTAMIAAL